MIQNGKIVVVDPEIVFKTFHGKKWHICKESDAFGPTSWCGINDMWRWVEEARLDQVPVEEICKICLRKRTEKEEKKEEEE